MATILIVEERPVTRLFVATLLQDRGHRLFEATDSEGALRIVRAEKPDLVLIDVLAPSMDGCQFVLNLRSEPGLVQPRVVFRAAAGGAASRTPIHRHLAAADRKEDPQAHGDFGKAECGARSRHYRARRAARGGEGRSGTGDQETVIGGAGADAGEPPLA